MLDLLLDRLPTSPDEFRQFVPLHLREQTDGAQVREYLDKILNILAVTATR